MKPSFSKRASEVKDRLDCFDVLNQYGAEYNKRAPYREDSNPSFSIFANGERWKDFATGEGGDILDLIQKFEDAGGQQCDLSRALEIAESLCGISHLDRSELDRSRFQIRKKRKPAPIEPTRPSGPVLDWTSPDVRSARIYGFSDRLGGPDLFFQVKNKRAADRRYRNLFAKGAWWSVQSDETVRPGLNGQKPFIFVPAGELPAAGDLGILCEGPSDCLAIHGAVVEGRRLYAVSLPYSSATFREDWIDLFRCLPEWSVIADSGAAGAKHAHKAARQLIEAGIGARIVDLPGFDGRCNKPEKQGQPSDNEDLKDWLQVYGRTAADLVGLIEATPARRPLELPEISETLVNSSLEASSETWIEAAEAEADPIECLVKSCLQMLFTRGIRQETKERWIAAASPVFERAEEIAAACHKYARANGWTSTGKRRQKLIYGDSEPSSGISGGLEIGETQDRIQAFEDELFEHVGRHYEASKEWQAAETWIEENISDQAERKRQRRKAKAEIQKRHRIRLSAAHREFWRYTAGAGKSESALRLIKRLMDRFPGFRAFYAVPDLELASELEARAVGIGVDPSAVRVFKGKTQPRVCLIEQECGAVSALQAAGFSAAELCEKVNPVTGEVSRCKHFETCAYQRAIQEARRGGLTIAAHSFLDVQSKLSGIGFDLRIVDEAFQAWHRSHVLLREELTDPGIWKPAEQAAVEGIGESLWTWIQGGCDLEEMRRNGWTSRTFGELSGKLSELEVRPMIQPNLRPDVLLKRIQETNARNAENRSLQSKRKVAKLLDNLRIETKHEGRPIQAVRFVPARGEASARIRIEEFRKPKLSTEAPCLILDATGSELIARRLYGEDLVFRRIEARRSLVLHQVTTSSFSKSYLGIGRKKDPEPDQPSRGFERTVAALKILKPEAVIAPKDFETRIEPELERRGVIFGHFGKITGTNRFQSCVSAAIVGRSEPAADAVEAMARALNIEQQKPLVLRGEYPRLLRWYDLPARRGRRAGVLVNHHDDPTCQAVLESVREAEIEQAIDRLRPVHHAVEVWLFTNVPVPDLPVTDLIELDAITGGFGSEARLACAWNQTGFLPLKADGMILSGMAPSVFKTASEAAETLKRSKCRNKNNNQIWSGSNKNYIELDHIWKFPDLKDLLQNLEEAAGNLGPVGVFEFKTSAGAKRWSRLLVQLDRVSTSPETIEGVFRAFLVNLGFELAAFRTVSLPMVGTFDTTAAIVAEPIGDEATVPEVPVSETMDQQPELELEEAGQAPRWTSALRLIASMVLSGMDRKMAEKIAFEGLGLVKARVEPRTQKAADCVPFVAKCSLQPALC